MEYEDHEMEDRNEDREEKRERNEERYKEYDDYSQTDLLKERASLLLRKDNDNENDMDPTEIDSRIRYLDMLLRKIAESRGYDETSFIDNNDGKTVTITNRNKTEKVSVPRSKFVEEIEEEIPEFENVREEIIDLSLREQEEIERRLSRLTPIDRDFMKDEIERVKSINEKIQQNYGKRLGTDYVSREIINRSKVSSKSGAVYFKRKLGDGSLGKAVLIIRKKSRWNNELIFTKNKDKAHTTALKQFQDLVKRIPDTNTIHDGGETSNRYPDQLGSGHASTSSKYQEEIETENFPLIQTFVERPHITGLTLQENRELEGVLNPPDTILLESRIGENGALQKQADYFEETMNKTIEQRDTEEHTEEEFEEMNKRIDALREARDRTLEQKKLEEVRDQQEEDISRFKKFKKWAKENMVGLSVVAISIGGIITSIVISARKAIVKGAQALGKFGKAVYDIGKKLAPLLAPLLSIVSQVLTMGAKGLAWLASNLWVLVLFTVWFLYDYFSKRKR